MVNLDAETWERYPKSFSYLSFSASIPQPAFFCLHCSFFPLHLHLTLLAHPFSDKSLEPFHTPCIDTFIITLPTPATFSYSFPLSFTTSSSFLTIVRWECVFEEVRERGLMSAQAMICSEELICCGSAPQRLISIPTLTPQLPHSVQQHDCSPSFLTFIFFYTVSLATPCQ